MAKVGSIHDSSTAAAAALSGYVEGGPVKVLGTSRQWQIGNA